MKVSYESNYVSGHGRIRVGSRFPGLSRLTESAPVSQDRTRTCGPQVWKHAGPFFRRFGQGRRASECFDKHFLAFLQQRQKTIVISELAQPIDSKSMQKHDRPGVALVVTIEFRQTK